MSCDDGIIEPLRRQASLRGGIVPSEFVSSIRIGADYQVDVENDNYVSGDHGPILLCKLEEDYPTQPAHIPWDPLTEKVFSKGIKTHGKDFKKISIMCKKTIKETILFYYLEFKQNKKYAKKSKFDSRQGFPDYDSQSEDDVCCLCSRSMDDLYGCDRCTKWFCLNCTGAKSPDNLPDTWFCAKCSRRRPTKRPRRRLRSPSGVAAKDVATKVAAVEFDGAPGVHGTQELTEELSTRASNQRRNSRARRAPQNEFSVAHKAQVLDLDAASWSEEVLWGGQWFLAVRSGLVDSGVKFFHPDDTVTIVPFDDVGRRVRPRQQAASVPFPVASMVHSRRLGGRHGRRQDDPSWRPAVVQAVRGDFTYDVRYDDGVLEESVPRIRLRARQGAGLTPDAHGEGPGRKDGEASRELPTGSPKNLSPVTVSASIGCTVEAGVAEPVAAPLSPALPLPHFLGPSEGAMEGGTSNKRAIEGAGHRTMEGAYHPSCKRRSPAAATAAGSVSSVTSRPQAAKRGFRLELNVAGGAGPSALLPAALPLDRDALSSAAGFVVGRSSELRWPLGAVLRPSEESVAAVSAALGADLSADKVISRRHCRFTVAASDAGTLGGAGEGGDGSGRTRGLFIEDLGSTNGTWVDGKRLALLTRTPLHNGSRVQIGLPHFGIDYMVRRWKQ